MGDSVDNRLGDSSCGKFVFDGNPDTYCTGPDGQVDFGQDEVQSLISHFKDSAAECLVRRNGFFDFGPVKVQAFNTGREYKSLRLFAEQQHSGVGWLVIHNQSQVLQQLQQRCAWREWKVTFSSGYRQKPGSSFG